MNLRIVFLMLLLGNIAFFAWDRYLRAPVDAMAHIQQVQITPEKIRLVKGIGQGVAAPAAKVAIDDKPALSAAPACLEWGYFIGPDAQRADAAMAQAGLPAAQVRRVISDMNGQWVVIPPFKTRAEARAVTDTLKEAGITDFEIMTEPPQWRNAISLGIFRTEESARGLLDGLKKNGVTQAVIEKRERFFRKLVYYVREPNEAMVAKLAALRTAMPGSEVKAVECPAPGAQ